MNEEFSDKQEEIKAACQLIVNSFEANEPLLAEKADYEEYKELTRLYYSANDFLNRFY